MQLYHNRRAAGEIFCRARDIADIRSSRRSFCRSASGILDAMIPIIDALIQKRLLYASIRSKPVTSSLDPRPCGTLVYLSMYWIESDHIVSRNLRSKKESKAWNSVLLLRILRGNGVDENNALSANSLVPYAPGTYATKSIANFLAAQPRSDSH